MKTLYSPGPSSEEGGGGKERKEAINHLRESKGENVPDRCLQGENAGALTKQGKSQKPWKKL